MNPVLEEYAASKSADSPHIRRTSLQNPGGDPQDRQDLADHSSMAHSRQKVDTIAIDHTVERLAGQEFPQAPVFEER